MRYVACSNESSYVVMRHVTLDTSVEESATHAHVHAMSGHTVRVERVKCPSQEGPVVVGLFCSNDAAI